MIVNEGTLLYNFPQKPGTFYKLGDLSIALIRQGTVVRQLAIKVFDICVFLDDIEAVVARPTQPLCHAIWPARQTAILQDVFLQGYTCLTVNFM